MPGRSKPATSARGSGAKQIAFFVVEARAFSRRDNDRGVNAVANRQRNGEHAIVELAWSAP